MLLSGRGGPVESAPPGIRRPLLSAPSVLLAVVVRWDDPDALARAIARVPREFSIVGPAEAEATVAAIAADGAAASRRPCFTCHPPRRSGCRPTRGPACSSRRISAISTTCRRSCAASCATPAAIRPLPARSPSSSRCRSATRAGKPRSHWDVSIDTLEALSAAGPGHGGLRVPAPPFRRARKDGRVGIGRLQRGVVGPRRQARIHAGRSPDGDLPGRRTLTAIRLAVAGCDPPRSAIAAALRSA